MTDLYHVANNITHTFQRGAEYIKQLILERMEQKQPNENLILNEIFEDIVKLSISEEEVKAALSELQSKKRIRIVSQGGGMFWQLLIKRLWQI